MSHSRKMARIKKQSLFAILPLALAVHSVYAQDAQPAQKPLLVQQSGARPNIFVMLSSARSMTTKDAVVNGATLQRNQAFGAALQEVFSNPSWRNKFRLGYGLSTGVVKNEMDTMTYGRLAGSNATELGPSKALFDGPKLFGDKVQRTFDAWLEIVYYYGDVYPHNFGIYKNPNVPEFDGKNFSNINRLNEDDSSVYNMVHLIGSYLKNNTQQAYEGQDCRKSYAIIFADGGNRGHIPEAGYPWAGKSSDDGPIFTGSPGGESMSLAYRPYEPYTASTYDYSNKQRYIPYPRREYLKPGYDVPYDASLGYNAMKNQPGDMTAYYYWHTDLAPNLGNNVPPRPAEGDPTFWQNLVTYTIAWKNARASLKRFNMGEVATYQQKYLADNYLGATGFQSMIPQWNSDLSALSEAYFDGFVRAGFTGGGKGIITDSVEGVKDAFKQVINGILSASGNDAGVAVSGSGGSFDDLSKSHKYMVEYRTADNSGDIKAYYLNAAGVVDTTKGAKGLYWSAKGKVPKPDERRIYTIGQSSASLASAPLTNPLRFMHPELTQDVKDALGVGSDASVQQNFVRYLRGHLPSDTSTAYRKRSSQIAAIVNAPPFYAGGRLDMGYDYRGNVQGGNSYLNWLRNKIDWKGSIFAPTNSGYVHVLDDAGNETAVYLPRGAMPKLKDFARGEGYDFEYLTDGPLAESDIFEKTGEDEKGYATGNWNQMLYGSGGRGGKFLYALRFAAGEDKGVDSEGKSKNVGGPRASGLKDFIWEINDKTLDAANGNTGKVALGFVTNRATSGQTLDIKDQDGKVIEPGKWVTLYTSGHYGASGGKPGLVVVDAMKGNVLKTIALPEGNAQTNGLGGITAVRDSKQRLVAAYGGDKQGNLWRFDLRPDKWKISYAEPLGTTGNRPVYAAPAWQPHPQGGNIVVFGTGILLADDDIKDTTVHRVIGLWDPTPVGGDDLSADAWTQHKAKTLLEQSIDLAKDQVGEGSGNSDGMDFFKMSNNQPDWSKNKGWYFELKAKPYPYKRKNGMDFNFPSVGERVIGDLVNLGRNVVIGSAVINASALGSVVDSCAAKATSAPNFVYVVKALTGATTRSFDADGDKMADDYSVAYVPVGGFTRGMEMVRYLKLDPTKNMYGAATAFLDPKNPPTSKDRQKRDQTINPAGESRTPPGPQKPCPEGEERACCPDEDCECTKIKEKPEEPVKPKDPCTKCVRIDLRACLFGTTDPLCLEENRACAWGRTWRPILLSPAS